MRDEGRRGGKGKGEGAREDRRKMRERREASLPHIKLL